MSDIRETDLTWEDGHANVGLYYLRAQRKSGTTLWGWTVGDGENWLELADGVAESREDAQRAAVDALAAHLEEMMTAIRAWRGEEV